MPTKAWFKLASAIVLAFAFSTTIAVAQGSEHDQDRHDREDHEHGRDFDRDHHEFRYSDHDRDEMRAWYREHHDHLPPGLARRDELPPELARRLVVHEVLPVELRARIVTVPVDFERRLPPPPPDCQHVFIGGQVVLMNRLNFQVVDVFHF
jgi:Ni/Co efflux regulator RcnB